MKGDLSAPRTIELDTFVKEIRRETPPQIIQEIRENISYMSPFRKSAYTEKIPAVIFSSLYKRKEWTAYTGLILIEFNQLANRIRKPVSTSRIAAMVKKSNFGSIPF